MAALSAIDLPVEPALLAEGDPEVHEIVNPAGGSRIVLVCEHAGRRVPASLGDLGLPAAEFDRHIAWDIGAEGLSRHLARLLDARLILQRYSRLVVDCNRPFEAADAVPETSDGTPIPANARLAPSARAQRFAAIHVPFHDRLAALLDAHPAGARTILVAIHSFTPMLLSQRRARPWHVGLLYNRDGRFSRRLMVALEARRPGLPAAFNEPYWVDDDQDYTIPVHAERRGIEHALVEIRNDLIADGRGQAEWAGLLAEAIAAAAGGPRIMAGAGR